MQAHFARRKKVKRRFSAKKLKSGYKRKRLSVGLHYGSFDGSTQRGLLFHLPHKCDDKTREIVDGNDSKPLTNASDAMRRIEALQEAGNDLTDFFQTRKLTFNASWYSGVFVKSAK